MVRLTYLWKLEGVIQKQHRFQSAWFTTLGSALWIGMTLASHAQAPAGAPSAAPATLVMSVAAGSDTFRTYCAVCHGSSARGDGPLADSMKRRPGNLTEIAKRNGGSFPTDLVFRTIDGRQPVRGHGGPDMPVWGDAFKRSAEIRDEAAVRVRIDSLVSYLESIQLRVSQ